MAGEGQPSRPGFSRGPDLRRRLGDQLLRQKCKQKPRDNDDDDDAPAAAEPPPPRVQIFLFRPSRAAAYRMSETEFFTNDPNNVRYVLFCVGGRRLLWALSARVLHERCPAWLREYPWKKSYRSHDSLPLAGESDVRALRAIMSLVHGNHSGGVDDLLPACGPFDGHFVTALVDCRDQFDLGPLVDPSIHNILEYLSHAGEQDVLGLKEWPLLVSVCSRFECPELFNMLSQRFIRKCEIDCNNLPMCQGINICGDKTHEWCQEFLSRRQAVIDEALDFLQDTATNFVSSPEGQSKPRCAQVITQQLGQVRQGKTTDGRFTTTSLEDIVEGLRKDDDGDADLPPAAASWETLEEVALEATKIVDCRVSHMLSLMK